MLQVTRLEFPWFGSQTGQNSGSSSPTGEPRKISFPPSKSIHYPTPGSSNPEVSLWLVDLTNTSDTTDDSIEIDYPRKQLKPPPIFDDQ